jgi:platelet-activating factor acetylhydrolase IB subunit alpha
MSCKLIDITLQSIHLWNSDTGERITELRGHDHIVECVKFLPPRVPFNPSLDFSTTQLLASGSRDRNILIWNWKTEQVLRTLSGHDNWIRDLAFYQDTFLLSVSDDKSLRFWDIDKEKQVKVIHKAHDRFVTSLDSRRGWIATGSLDEKVHLYR